MRATDAGRPLRDEVEMGARVRGAVHGCLARPGCGPLPSRDVRWPPRETPTRLPWRVATGVTFLLAITAPRAALAACNAIPAAVTTFRGTTGSTSRPFASPGDEVEITINEADDRCHGSLPDLPANAVVTLAFVPPGGGPRTI